MSIIHAFASPIDVDTTHASSVVAGMVFERARNRLIGSLDKSDSRELIRGIADLSVESAAPWRPELGVVTSAHGMGHLNRAVLQLFLIGGPRDASLQANVEAPSYLFLDGWSLPVRGAVALQMHHDCLRIECESVSAGFRFEDGRWKATDNEENWPWPVHGIGSKRPRYLMETGIQGSSGLFPSPSESAAAFAAKRKPQGHAGPDGLRMLESAIECITNDSMPYGEWISSVVDGFVLTTGGSVIGTTSPEFPGLVALSPKDNALSCAETIVGAASNQKLFQLALVFSLTEPGLEEVHYVPSSRSYTTTRRVLVAAHEHVNVILMLRHLFEKSRSPDQIRHRIDKRALILDSNCAPLLDKSDILSDAGKILWARLCELAYPDEKIARNGRSEIHSQHERKVSATAEL